MDYSLQGNRKTEEGADHPDRDAQFQTSMIKSAGRWPRAAGHLRGHEKEGIDWKLREHRASMAQERRRQGATAMISPRPPCPGPIPTACMTSPATTGSSTWGRITTRAPLRWPRSGAGGGRGPPTVSASAALLITADGGGSNGYRLRLWKLELQKLADATTLAIGVCHFPPGTSKWNKVEHRFLVHLLDWRGEPLRDYETVVRLIAGTRPRKGFASPAASIGANIPSGRKVTDEEMKNRSA